VAVSGRLTVALCRAGECMVIGNTRIMDERVIVIDTASNYHPLPRFTSSDNTERDYNTLFHKHLDNANRATVLLVPYLLNARALAGCHIWGR
jgi:hypothetical protein